jgi:peptidyl-prolyl cis-trans isomerase C
MLRRLAVIGLAALALTACKGKKSGPVVARGEGFTITADEFKARVDEQAPFLRARYNTLDRKKEFVDSLVRQELLYRQAEKEGLREDPEVQQIIRKVMIQRLYQRKFNPVGDAGAVPAADVQKFYDDHAAEFHRPKRVRASVVAFLAAPGTPERTKKLAAARKALAGLQAEEKDPKTGPAAFAKLAQTASEDAASRPAGGDVGLRTLEELQKAYSPELAQAIFALKQGETSGVIEAPQGLYLARANLVQEEVTRTLEQMKPQIQMRLAREKGQKDFDAWFAKIKEQAKVTVDEKALDAVQLAPPQGPGAPGAAPGGPAMGPAPEKPVISVQPAGPAPAK